MILLPACLTSQSVGRFIFLCVRLDPDKPAPTKTLHAGLLEPPLLQLLSLYHRFSNGNSSSQSSDRQHKLSFVKALAEDVKRVRWRCSAPKQVESICENQGSRLEESRRGDYLPDVRNLKQRTVDIEKKTTETVPHVPRIDEK